VTSWRNGVPEAQRTTLTSKVTDLARQAGAADPGQLARQLTLVIDGRLAAGVLDADPAAAQAAKAAARILVDAACCRG
jgi:hypothetical protein